MDIDLLRAGDVGPAGRLLAHSFEADPVVGRFLRGRVRRPIAYPAFFRSVLRLSLPYGHVYSAHDNGQLVGVAAWIPPRARRLSRSERLRAKPDELLARGLFPGGMRGIDQGFAGLADLHPPAPHWYLEFVGIEAGRQGDGIGAQILAPVLLLADAAGETCYLETPFERTFPFYERLGFAHSAETRPFPGAPPVWTMLRSATSTPRER